MFLSDSSGRCGGFGHEMLVDNHSGATYLVSLQNWCRGFISCSVLVCVMFY